MALRRWIAPVRTGGTAGRHLSHPACDIVLARASETRTKQAGRTPFPGRALTGLKPARRGPCVVEAASGPRRLRGVVHELGEQRLDAGVEVVDDAPHGVEVLTLRVVHRPVLVPLARHVRAGLS